MPVGGDPVNPVISGHCDMQYAGTRDHHPTRNCGLISTRHGSTPNPKDVINCGASLGTVVPTSRQDARPTREIGNTLGKPDLAGCRSDRRDDIEGISRRSRMLDTGMPAHTIWSVPSGRSDRASV